MAQHTLSDRVRDLHISPLVNSLNPTFADWYTFGLGWCLFGGRESDGLLDDHYFLHTFRQCRKLHYFESQCENHLYRTIGLALGMIHGGVLLPDGTVQPDATTLVTLNDRDTIRGYCAGRVFFFEDADTEEEWHRTDDSLIERLRGLANEYTEYKHPLRVVHFIIGCILGELSGHLFPWTREEQQASEAESIKILGYVCKLNPKSLAAQQFALEAVS